MANDPVPKSPADTSPEPKAAEGDKKALIEKEVTLPAEKVSVINLVEWVVDYAYEARASDIHFDPGEDKVKIRFRIDGVLHTVFNIPKGLQDEVISRIKVLSGLRTDEHQAAQDGRFRITLKDARFDIRVSITPTYYQENAVLRLLVEQGQDFTLEKMRFSKGNLDKVQRAMTKPYGMILATGPTGSGKTTTLYTILRILNTDNVSIITIEDPIEYSVEGMNQIQVNPQTGLTFANGLRSVLRQDPNIIMIGEVRDQETAGIAVNAALTGHLLLATLHTNDAATTLPRLIDMHVEPFLIASTVNIAIGQRLVRKVCEACTQKRHLTVSEIQKFSTVIPKALLRKNKDYEFSYGVGCKVCNGSGYKGRVGVHEVLEVTEAIRDAITKRMSASDIKQIATHEGMTTMLEDGFDKAIAGVTTFEEVLRVMHE